MATYYVDTAVGNDSNAGTSPGSGNAWATLGKAASVAIYGDKVNVKASGTYTITSGVTFDSTDSVPNSAPLLVEGYTTTPGDGGQVTVSTSNAITMLTANSGAANIRFANFILDGTDNALIGVVGANTGRGGSLWNTLIKRCCTKGVSTNAMALRLVRVTDMKSGATCAFDVGQVAVADCCIADTNPCHGWSMGGNNTSVQLHNCIAAANKGGSYIGFNMDGALENSVCEGLVAYDNGSHGFAGNGTYQAVHITNSVFALNGGYGLILNYSQQLQADFDYNAFGTGGQVNTSGARSNATAGTNDTTFSGDPFANYAGLASATGILDALACFLPNATASAGAALRAAGSPQYRDIGAVQHQDTGGGGGVVNVAYW